MKARRREESVSPKSSCHIHDGAVIRMLRELKGWIQAELADLLSL